MLRVNADGTIPTDNPFYAQGGNARYVWNYGHRNVQGLALRPGTDELWTAEHGTGRDDEINQVVRGANYGWDPGPGYNESPPMTDLTKFPDAVPARLESGNPTDRHQRAHLPHRLGLGSLAGRAGRRRAQGPGHQDHVPRSRRAGNRSSTDGGRARATFGRIRTVQPGPDGALYFTTSNGGGRDVIGKITPTGEPPTVEGRANVSRVRGLGRPDRRRHLRVRPHRLRTASSTSAAPTTARPGRRPGPRPA